MSLKFLIALTLLSHPAFSQTEEPLPEMPGIEEAHSIEESTPVTEPVFVPVPAPVPTPEKPTNKQQDTGLIGATGQLIADSRNAVSDRVILLANKVDGLFGDTRALDEYYASSLKVTTGSLYNGKNGTYDNSFSTSLILSLPNLKQRERDFNDFWNRRPDQPPDVLLDEDLITPEEFKEQNPWNFATETGIRWKWPIAYYAKLRGSRNYLTGKVVHHLTDELGWDSESYWNSKVSLASDYAYSKYFLLRFINEANWYMSQPSVFSTTQGPSWIYSFYDKSLLSFDLRFNMRSIKLQMYTDSYTTGFTYRTGFKKVKWIFLEVSPLLAWRYEDDFRPSTTVNVTLDFMIGREKSSVPKSSNPLDLF
ncbi:hypothetical protein B9G69_000350 [Bdellovibrio sp. SKB1291214]|uniref:hypothetical protein n=1 Tax=Bdellovibrio sp. SKB1291214 TaxID=1732569 RepID=UPI000B51A642|nr:hypothetical protein [Bdellovibrio sp. SKB1291214]UYL09024.1 hypothetical protein B9G69_000350 [Bdellovibrio sp. SKB1291214]